MALAGKQHGSGTEIKFAHAEEIIHVTGQEEGCETVLLHSTTKFSLRTDWGPLSTIQLPPEGYAPPLSQALSMINTNTLEIGTPALYCAISTTVLQS